MIDPPSAIWGYGFGRYSAKREMEVERRKRRTGRRKKLIYKPMIADDGRLILYLRNAGDVNIGADAESDDVEDLLSKYLEISLYELFDKPIEVEKKIGFLKFKVKKKKIKLSEIRFSGLSPGEEEKIKFDVIVKPESTYLIEICEMRGDTGVIWTLKFKGQELTEKTKKLVLELPIDVFNKLERICSESGITPESLIISLLDRISEKQKL